MPYGFGSITYKYFFPQENFLREIVYRDADMLFLLFWKKKKKNNNNNPCYDKRGTSNEYPQPMLFYGELEKIIPELSSKTGFLNQFSVRLSGQV